MYEWFQGSFSNNMQYQRDKRDQEKVGGEPLRDHVWVKFFKVDVPSIGTNVLMCRQGEHGGKVNSSENDFVFLLLVCVLGSL